MRHGGHYEALADGTYRRYGLDVTIVPGGPNVLFDGKRLRRHITLHGAFLVHKEGLRVRRIWFHSFLVETVIGLEPLKVARQPLLRDEQGELFQILEFVDALVRMRDQHL